MTRSHKLTGLVIAAVAAVASPALAQRYSTIYAFGDSLSDAGNVYLATSRAQPAAPYFAGHYSNGLTWVENVSKDLSLGTLTPSLIGGNDFAFGGAVTGTSVSNVTLSVPTIGQQVSKYLSGHTPSATALYTVWIGANDLFQAITNVATASANGPSAGLAAFVQAKSQATAAAQVEANAINTLAQAGAKTFLVPLVPDLGLTPSVNTTGLASVATSLAATYNSSLQTDLGTVASSDNVTVDVLDTFSLQDNAVANPSAYGLTNVTDKCYTGPFTGGGSACSNPGSYLFWDGVHPTETGQQVIASAALNAIPEPGSWAILVGALATLAFVRRRGALKSGG